jgi:hypothetical protein
MVRICAGSQTNQIVSGRQLIADTGSDKQAVSGKLCGGSQTQSSYLWKAGKSRRSQSRAGRKEQKSAKEARRSQVGSKRHGTGQAGSNEQAGRGRHLRWKPDVDNLARAGRLSQTQPVTSRPTGADDA